MEFYNINYSQKTSFGIGGNILTAFPETTNELISLLEKQEYVLFGKGTNSVVKESSEKLFINTERYNGIEYTREGIWVKAGTTCHKLSESLMGNGFTENEWLYYLPGTIGGAVYSNASFFRKKPISKYVKKVLIFNGITTLLMEKDDLLFGWRDSIFKKNNNFVILKILLDFPKGSNQEARELCLLLRQNQYTKFPKQQKGTFGTMFKKIDFLRRNKHLVKTYKYKSLLMPPNLLGWVFNMGGATLTELMEYYYIICNEMNKELGLEINILG